MSKGTESKFTHLYFLFVPGVLIFLLLVRFDNYWYKKIIPLNYLLGSKNKGCHGFEPWHPYLVDEEIFDLKTLIGKRLK
jgi:hypothetical protein